eukprot:7866357-Ditylum_brightwellii.AAC.1
MSMPFVAGFTPTRWQTALDFMLEKDVGSPKITCLQIIAIVEGNMNAIMKKRLDCIGCTTAESGDNGLPAPVSFEWRNS